MSPRLESTSPAAWGAYLALAGALASFGFGLYLLVASEMSATLAVAIMVVGVVQGLTSAMTLFQARAAWAFALSLNGTLSVCCLFGAPKIRDAAGIPIPLALLPFLFFGATTALYSMSDDFKSRRP